MKNCFAILTTNLENINANHSELQVLIVHELSEKDFEFSVICIPKSWLSNHDNYNRHFHTIK